jgi:antitoxin VapB
MKEAKLFRNGQSQAVRLPKEFRLSGKAVYVRQLGDAVMLIPKRHPWRTLTEACGMFTIDFLSKRQQGRSQRDNPFR